MEREREVGGREGGRKKEWMDGWLMNGWMEFCTFLTSLVCRIKSKFFFLASPPEELRWFPVQPSIQSTSPPPLPPPPRLPLPLVYFDHSSHLSPFAQRKSFHIFLFVASSPLFFIFPSSGCPRDFLLSLPSPSFLYSPVSSLLICTSSHHWPCKAEIAHINGPASHLSDLKSSQVTQQLSYQSGGNHHHCRLMPTASAENLESSPSVPSGFDSSNHLSGFARLV